MTHPDFGTRTVLRLNAARFEAFVRGGRREGALSVHRKLDGMRIAAGRWRRVEHAWSLDIAVTPRLRPTLDAALGELAPLLRRVWPRIGLFAAVGSALARRLPRRGPARRRGADAGALMADRAALAAALAAIPPDYAATRGMPRQREARILALAGHDVSARECWLLPAVARRMRALAHAAQAEGVILQLVSGFRSAAYQARIVERKRSRGQTMTQILAVNAAPGHSEHHSGRAVDLTTPGHSAVETSFEQSPAFAWLGEHAERFRIRLSYPRDNPHGIVYEPWHWFFED